MEHRLSNALAYWLAAPLLAACSAPANPVNPTPVSPPAETAKTKGELLYVGVNYGVNVFTYPRIKFVASLPSDESFPAVCSDPKTGHVFVSETQGLDEYEHGGTTAIETLAVPPGYTALQGCSIDPISGDVAVVAYEGYKGGGLLIYHHGRGNPRTYSDPTVHAYYYCSYDNRGNVFVLAYGVGSPSVYPVFTELPKGAGSFRDLTLSGYLQYPKKVQWDGKHLALTLSGAVYQVDVSGSNAKIVGSTRMFGDNMWAAGITWIAHGTVIAGHGDAFARRLGVWPYPAGGYPLRVTPHVTAKNVVLSDVNLSEPPQH